LAFQNQKKTSSKKKILLLPRRGLPAGKGFENVDTFARFRGLKAPETTKNDWRQICRIDVSRWVQTLVGGLKGEVTTAEKAAEKGKETNCRGSSQCKNVGSVGVRDQLHSHSC